MGHRIDLAEIPDTLTLENQLAGSFGLGEQKELVVEFTYFRGAKPGVRFVVRDHRTEVFRSEDLERAVEAYNAH